MEENNFNNQEINNNTETTNTLNQEQINNETINDFEETRQINDIQVNNQQEVNNVTTTVENSQLIANKVDTTSNNNKKNNKIAIIIFIILFIIGFGIGFALSKKDKNKTKDDDANTNNNIDNTDVIDVEPTQDDNDQKANNGQELTIYKVNQNDYIYYTDEKPTDKEQKIEKSFKFNCKTIICKFKTAEQNYAIVDEDNGEYSLYDFEKNKLIYSFNLLKVDKYYDYPYIGFIQDFNEKIYGIYYDYERIDNENKYTNIYIIKNDKYYSKIEGVASGQHPGHDNSIIGDKYVTIHNSKGDNETESFLNIETGKIDYTLNGYVSDVVEVSNKSYYVIYNEKSKLYNINGKVVIDELEGISSNDNLIAIQKNNKFYVYDSDLKLKKESKIYTEILQVDKDFVLAQDNKKLLLLDYNDNILTTFLTDYTKDKYTVHTMLSGWYTDNGKNGIYIVIGVDGVPYEEIVKSNPTISKEDYEDMGGGYEYYYIPTTKETGKIATVIGGYAKPVLYLYPTKKTNITVNFEHEDMLTTTYPKFNKEWKVTANPNGDLYDKDGNYYYALYWEENGNHKVDFSTGFYVEKENAIKFLEEKLEYIGLSKKERNEFIMYWLPILEKNQKSLVYFELTQERDLYNKLIINPKPDSLLRIAIHIKKVDKKTNIKEQKLTKFERKGFTAVEWGGVNYN